MTFDTLIVLRSPVCRLPQTGLLIIDADYLPLTQNWLYEYIKDNGTVKLNQITLLRNELQSGAITQAKMIMLLNNSQPGKAPSSKLTLSEKKLREYFPPEYSTAQMRNVIEDLLCEWKRNRDDIFEQLNEGS